MSDRDGTIRPSYKTRETYASFAEFWPDYVRVHLVRSNRLLHSAGTAAGLLMAAVGLRGCASGATAGAWLILAAPVVGYGCAWLGHFVIEKNRPATFQHPVWSLLGDLKMLALTAAGRMEAEVRRVQEMSVSPRDV
jgi:hypothetical protein